MHILKMSVKSNLFFFFLVGLEPGQSDQTQPTIMQQDWKTLLASRKKRHSQRGITTEGGAPPLAPLVQGSATQGRHRDDDGCGTGTLRWRCVDFTEKQKKEEKRENKKRMTKCEKNMKENKTLRKKTISSCTDLADNHGAHRRDQRLSYEQKQEKKRRRKKKKKRM